MPPTKPKTLARSSWSFSAAEVRAGTEAYPDVDRDAARWLYHHSKNDGISMRAASEGVGYSPSTITRYCRGIYGGENGGSVSAVTDAVLAHLKGFTNLETMELIEISVTGAGLVHLKGFTNLEAIDLYFTIGDQVSKVFYEFSHSILIHLTLQIMDEKGSCL